MDRLEAEKIIYHAEKLVEIKNTGDTYPVHMTMGLTDYCNHSCIFCNTEFATADKSRTHTLDVKTLLSFLKGAAEKGLKAVTICGSGEPLIHPDFVSILYGIHSLGIDIGIFTNGYMLNKEIRKAILDTCTFVRCSINASNSVEHETVHRVKNQFQTIVDNVANLVKEKKDCGIKLPTIGTQFVFYEDNYKSMVDAAELWEKIGVDYFEIKPLIEGEGSAVGQAVFPVLNKEDVRYYMQKAKSYETDVYKVYTKYGQYERSVSVDKRCYRKCYGHAIDPNLWSDGNMYLCSNQEHEKDIIGNIYQNTFEEIWNGEKRKKRISEINVDACPRGCRCDGINQIIWDYLNPDEGCHPNFV